MLGEGATAVFSSPRGRPPIARAASSQLPHFSHHATALLVRRWAEWGAGQAPCRTRRPGIRRTSKRSGRPLRRDSTAMGVPEGHVSETHRYRVNRHGRHQPLHPVWDGALDPKRATKPGFSVAPAFWDAWLSARASQRRMSRVVAREKPERLRPPCSSERRPPPKAGNRCRNTLPEGCQA